MDWDKYERDQQKRFLKSFQSCGNDALVIASESAAHWNRMYRELIEQQQKEILASKQEISNQQIPSFLQGRTT